MHNFHAIDMGHSLRQYCTLKAEIKRDLLDIAVMLLAHFAFHLPQLIAMITEEFSEKGEPFFICRRNMAIRNICPITYHFL